MKMKISKKIQEKLQGKCELIGEDNKKKIRVYLPQNNITNNITKSEKKLIEKELQCPGIKFHHV